MRTPILIQLLLALPIAKSGYHDTGERYALNDQTDAEVLRKDNINEADDFGLSATTVDGDPDGMYDPDWFRSDKLNAGTSSASLVNPQYVTYPGTVIKSFCAVSVFQNPSGDKVCYVREFQTKSDAQQMCIDNGFSGLIEARSVEDMLFTSRLECWLHYMGDGAPPGMPPYPPLSEIMYGNYMWIGTVSLTPGSITEFAWASEPNVKIDLSRFGEIWGASGVLATWFSSSVDRLTKWKAHFVGGTGSYPYGCGLVAGEPVPGGTGENSFALQKEPCGGVQPPTNNRLKIYPKEPGTEEPYDGDQQNFVLACNILSSELWADKMKHSLFLLPMSVQFRRTRLTFHQVCGTGIFGAHPCSFGINLELGVNDETEFYVLDDSLKFNNGTLGSVTHWGWEDLLLPPIGPGTRLRLWSEFDRFNGGLNLDNVNFYTQQKCIPRWSIMKNMMFKADYKLKFKRNLDIRTFDKFGVREAQLLKRYYKLESKGVEGVEECARLCLLSRSCDMFEYASSSCSFYPNHQMKTINIHRLVKIDTSNAKNIYVLHCSTPQENWLLNSDAATHSREPWVIVQNDCLELFAVEQHFSGGQQQSKHAVNGWYQYMTYAKCDDTQIFEIEQIVKDWPYDIDADYITAVKPRGLLRTWFGSLEDRSDKYFNYGITMTFYANNWTEVANKTLGGINKYEDKAYTIDELFELTYVLPDMSTFTFESFKVNIKFISEENGTRLYIGPAEVLLDLPYVVGCYELLDDISSEGQTISEDPAVMTPVWCITKCLNRDSTKRFAFIKNGDECTCYEELPLAKMQMVSSEKESNVCNMTCNGNSNYICGGPNAVSVFVATCKEGQIRFQDHCYTSLPAETDTLNANADACEDMGGHLWYPETSAEMAFIREVFPIPSGELYHLGVYNYSISWGIWFIDGTYSPGIPFYTSKSADFKDKIGNESSDYMRMEKCLTFNPENEKWEEQSDCVLAKGICKYKLVMGQGYEPIGNTVGYKIISSEKAIVPSAFNGEGSIHIQLLADPFVVERYIDIQLSTQVVLSGIKFEMPDDKALKRFGMYIGEAGIQYPDELSYMGKYRTHYGDLPTANTPKILKRTVMFQPLMADRVKLVVTDATTEILAKIELLGVPTEKAYNSNPIMDPVLLWEDAETTPAHPVKACEQICPGGAVYLSFFLPPSYKTVNSKVGMLGIASDVGTFNLEFAVNPISILRWVGSNTAEDGNYPNIEPGSKIEIELRCGKLSWEIYMQGQFVSTFSAMHDSVVPKINSIVWSTYTGVSSPSLYYTSLPPFGIMDIFRYHTNSGTPPEPSHFSNNGEVDVVMKTHFTHIKVYEDSSDGEIVYEPAQANQHCFRNGQNGIQCKIVSARYNAASGYGYGGQSGLGSLGCRTGFVAVGKTCFILPPQPATSKIEAGVACSNIEGATLYSPVDVTQNVIMAAMMKHWGIDELWIDVKKDGEGVWSSKGQVFDVFQSDWDIDEPKVAAGADCAFISKSADYKMKTENCQAPKQYLCMGLSPNCPQGYSWLPSYGGGRTCLKIVGPIKDSTDSYITEFNVGNKMCLKDKTRLVAPDTDDDVTILSTWSLKDGVKPDVMPDFALFTGIKKFMPYGGPKEVNLILHPTWNKLIDLVVDNYTITVSPSTNSYCLVIGTGDTKEWKDCRGQSDHHFGVCEYTECATATGETCIFPFRYKGRIYDTCITLDSANPGEPWCSTGTDDFHNHIPGTESPCATSCFRVTNCPIGFYLMRYDDTCYQDSASSPNDLVQTFDGAEAKCAEQGARLLRIRSVEATKHLQVSRANYFDTGKVYITGLTTVVAMGMMYTKLGDDTERNLYYSDETIVDPLLVNELLWKTDYPSDNMTHTCVALDTIYLVNVPCEETAYYYDGSDDTKTALAYICEARVIRSKTSTDMCHFPFEFQNTIFTSCSTKPVATFNPDGKPWCATNVGSTGVVVVNKWTLCQDEREIIYKESGAGYYCPMPFIYDRIYYDYCTRRNSEADEGFADFYWCPNPNMVDANNKYNQSYPIGRCTQYLFPPENGCSESYEPISDKICVRLSAYPETYEAAQAKCMSEGGYLLFIAETAVENGLTELLKTKFKTIPRYNTIQSMWLGADYSLTDGWKWRDTIQRFSDFTRWEGNVENLGCRVDGGCTVEDGLVIRPSYGKSSDTMSIAWNAIVDKDRELPYVCMSACPRGYLWFPKTEKCLKVVHETSDTKVTLGDAMLTCTLDNARLAAVKSCDVMDLMMEEIFAQFVMDAQTYFVGIFALKDVEGLSYRNWEDNMVIDSLGYGVFGMETSGASLCNKGTDDFLSSDTKAESFIALKVLDESTREIQVTKFNQDDYTKDRVEAGFICEKENLWGCSDGWYMNQGHCFKLIRVLKNYVDAMLMCMAENAILAEPMTFIQSEFLESLVTYLDKKDGVANEAKKIWLKFRLDDPVDGQFFKFIVGHTNATTSAQSGDCVTMDIDGSGIHEGWNRVLCNQQAFVICQTNETLHPELQPFVAGPKALFPLNKTSGPLDILVNEVSGNELSVGYDSLWVPTGQLGSPFFIDQLDHQSHMDFDFSTILAETVTDFTVLLWVKPTKTTNGILFHASHEDSTTKETYELKVALGENVMVTIDHESAHTTESFTSVKTNKLVKNEWNFVGLTFNSLKNESTIFVNEGYGFDDGAGRMNYFPLKSYQWMSKVFKQPVWLGGNININITDKPFHGSISCLQVYDYALDAATLTLKKLCPDIPSEQLMTPCPQGYVFFDDWCYKIALTQASYAQAEVLCLPDKDSPYKTQLMWTENPIHWDYVGRLVELDTTYTAFWAGISDRDEDTFFSSSFGDNVTSSSAIFLNPGAQASLCGMAKKGDNGYLKTGYCDENRAYVCSSKPLYAKPDFICPYGFYPYKDKCLSPDVRPMTYDDAQVVCASKGSLLLSIRGEEMHGFVIKWGNSAVRGDMWVGLRKRKHVQFYDNDPTLFQPLQEEVTPELVNSDGSSFDANNDYAMGYRKFEEECYFFKQSAEYELRGSACNKEKGFICEWQGPDCPDGYSSIGQLSDGRTCHGTPSSSTDDFDTATCASDLDLQRKRWTPTSPYIMDRFRLEYAMGGPIWTDASMDPQGNWYLEGGTTDMITGLYTDMRRLDAGTWMPPDSILDVNGTTNGCLEITPSGLLNTRVKSECDTTQKTACEYKACMTKAGKKCLFPFRYQNDTHPDLTYKICSSLDVYRPWCPTKLDDTLNVVEWGDCLDDCPTEPVNSACLMEPEFPKFSEGMSLTVNFTSNFTVGSAAVTDEMDYVAFTCPVGYVFEGTNNITHFALCYNWEFIYLFDPEVLCVPVLCPPAEPPKVTPGTPLGGWVWDELDLPIYEAIIQYSCPEGYVFEVYQEFPNSSVNFGLIENETAHINLTCEAYGDWSPLEVPPCIPVNCTDEPIDVPGNDKGEFDWDSENKKFGSVVTYKCPKKGWGFPANGLSETLNECQADKSWTVTEIETCLDLPCRDQPPLFTPGGWFWYGLENSRYKCPNGFKFENGNYPYWYSNCTIQKTWDPPAVESCVRRECMMEPPEPYLGIDVVWPAKDRRMGTNLTYSCPFRSGTFVQYLKLQFVTCKWDKDTDNMVWWPPFIDVCNTAYSAFMTARSNRRCPKAQLRVRMSEKYLQIGTPMTSLPRPVTSANFSRIESALSNPAISSVKFHDCYHNSSMTNLKDPGGVIKMSSNVGSSALHICVMAKEDILQNKDSKFAAGMQVSCPYLSCNFKNSQFASAGRFPSEFLLNHLHCHHKHRRFNGDNLDLTMVVPQVEIVTELRRSSTKIDLSLNNGGSSTPLHPVTSQSQLTTHTWPFVEIYAHKRYFYLEAQSFTLDGHPEIFLWLWFLGSEQEELHYRYTLTVLHGKSEYTYKGPVTSLVKSLVDIKNEGRCLVIREKVWDYMSYKLKITKH